MKLLKIGGLGLSVVGLGINLLTDIVNRKTMVNELANSKEVKDLINKAVNEALKNRGV